MDERAFAALLRDHNKLSGLGYIVKGTASPDSQVWVDQVKLEVIRFDDP